jgi:hypothetical protein
MDAERTIQFLLDNAARAEARMGRSDARMDRLEASLAKIVQGLDQGKTLTLQLITLMSQQTAHHVKLEKNMDRRFKETNEQIARTSAAVERMSKRMDAFVATSGRTNGHSRKGKTGGN